MWTTALNAFLLLLSVATSEPIRSSMEDGERSNRNNLWNLDEREIILRPTSSSGAPIQVKCSMFLLDISEMDSKNMEYTAQFYFRQKWTDPKLDASNELYQGMVNKPAVALNTNDLKNIWKPDLFFVEARQGQLHTVTFPNTFLRVSPNGTAFRSMRLSLRLRCDMDLRTYPHDKQICRFSVESYRYTADEVQLDWEEDFLGHEDMNIPEFTFYGMSFSTDIVKLSTATYGRLIVEMTFKRKLGYFMTKLYAPYIFLVLISCLSFWINPKMLALRLSLLLSVLLIMFALAFDMSNYIPPASYTKAIDVWTAFCVSFVFGAFLEYIFVCQTDKERTKTSRRTAKDDQELGICQEELVKKDKDSCTIDERISTSKFVAQNLCKVHQWKFHTDLFFRYVYPILFGIFNVIYWCAYAS